MLNVLVVVTSSRPVSGSSAFRMPSGAQIFFSLFHAREMLNISFFSSSSMLCSSIINEETTPCNVKNCTMYFVGSVTYRPPSMCQVLQYPCLQLFRQRLSHKSVEVYSIMPIGIMGSDNLSSLD